MTQLNLFDYVKKLKPSEPPCYNCVFAIRRGNFRLCALGKDGYKKIGIWEFCKDRKEMDDGQDIPRKLGQQRKESYGS